MININLEDLKSHPKPSENTKQYYLYFLIHEEQVVYIGQTSLLLSRIITHTKDKLFTSFKYVLLDTTDMKEVLKIEKFYVNKYKPLFNNSSTTTFKTTQKIYHRYSNFILKKDIIYKSDFQDKLKYCNYVSLKQFSFVYDGEDIYSFLTSDPCNYYIYKNNHRIEVKEPLHDTVIKTISKYFSKDIPLKKGMIINLGLLSWHKTLNNQE